MSSSVFNAPGSKAPQNTPQNRVPQLKRALEKSGRQRRLIHRIKWTGLTVGGVLGLLLLFVLIDYAVVVAWTVRLGMLLVILGAAGFGIWKLVQKWHALGSALDVAREVERGNPNLGNMLSTAVEYGTWDPNNFRQYEAELVDQLLNQATKRRSVVAPDTVRALKFPLGLALGALVLIGLLAGFLPGASTAFRRALTPWSQALYTTLRVTPGSADIPEGRDVDVDILFGGRLPQEAQLAVEEAGQPWKNVPIKRINRSHYQHQFPNLHGTVRYRVVGPNIESPTFVVTAFPAPQVKEWNVGLKYPAYTKLPPRTQSLPDLSVLRGTEVTFAVQIAEPVAKLVLDFGNQRLDLMTSPGDHGEGTIPAAVSSPFYLEITDKQGRLTRSEKPYQFVVTPDRAPKVTVLKPAKNIRVRARDTTPIEMVVDDDFGLGTLKLVFKQLGKPPVEVTCTAKAEASGKFSATYPYDIAGSGLKVGDVVVGYATATDNNSLDGPGVGKSAAFFIEVTPNPQADKEDAGGQQAQEAQQERKDKEKIDLYELQKEILRVTMEAGESASAERLKALSVEQTKVRELGVRFKELVQAEGVNDPKLLGLIDEARAAMGLAAEKLAATDQPGAIAPEELAVQKLSALMAIIHPELLKRLNQQMRLENVKKQAEQEKRQQEAIPQMLERLNQLAQQQTELNREPAAEAEKKLAAEAAKLAAEAKGLDMKRAAEALKGAEAAMQAQAEGLQNPPGETAAQEPQDGESQSPQESQSGQSTPGGSRGSSGQAALSQDEQQTRSGELSVAKLLEAAKALKLLQGDADPGSEIDPAEYEQIIAAYFRKLSREE